MGSYTWLDFPTSGESDFESKAYSALNSWQQNAELMDDEITNARKTYSTLEDVIDYLDNNKADIAHSHGGGGVVISLVDLASNLGSGASDGEMKITYDEYGNFYTWDDDNSKWRIEEGNFYTTAGLPTAGTYTIPTGTRVFDVTLSVWQEWNGSSWAGESSSYRRIDKTTNYTMTIADFSGGITFTNNGAGADIQLDLVAGFDNAKVAFLVVDAFYLRVDAQAGEVISYQGVDTATGGYVRSNVEGTFWVIEWNGSKWTITLLSTALFFDQ